MFKITKIKAYFIIINFFLFFTSILHASSFDFKLKEIRGEINRDNLKVAINLLKEINIESELEQDKINILFGDIYLKINKPQKAEEFYQKAFFADYSFQFF